MIKINNSGTSPDMLRARKSQLLLDIPIDDIEDRCSTAMSQAKSPSLGECLNLKRAFSEGQRCDCIHRLFLVSYALAAIALGISSEVALMLGSPLIVLTLALALAPEAIRTVSKKLTVRAKGLSRYVSSADTRKSRFYGLRRSVAA